MSFFSRQRAMPNVGVSSIGDLTAWAMISRPFGFQWIARSGSSPGVGMQSTGVSFGPTSARHMSRVPSAFSLFIAIRFVSPVGAQARLPNVRPAGVSATALESFLVRSLSITRPVVGVGDVRAGRVVGRVLLFLRALGDGIERGAVAAVDALDVLLVGEHHLRLADRDQQLHLGALLDLRAGLGVGGEQRVRPGVVELLDDDRDDAEVGRRLGVGLLGLLGDRRDRDVRRLAAARGRRRRRAPLPSFLSFSFSASVFLSSAVGSG